MRALSIVALCAVLSVLAWWQWQQETGEPLPQAEAPPAPALSPAAPVAAADSPGAGAASDPAPPETDCTITRRYLPAPDGTAIETIACDPLSVAEPHPYTHYTNAALESLAYADADAARILGMRLIEKDRAASLSLVIRAAALAGGDPAPLQLYSNAYPDPEAVDGVPQPSVVRLKYVLASVVALLNEDRTAKNAWEPVIRAHARDPDGELARLQAQALDIVAEMRQIQVEVEGQATIGGPGDV